MKKDKNGFLEIDGSVAALIGNGDRRQAERQMPRAERAKLHKKQDQQAERNGRRAAYDFQDPDVIKRIADLGKEQGCSASNVAEIALQLFLQADVDLSKYREPLEKYHPKYDCRLVWKK